MPDKKLARGTRWMRRFWGGPENSAALWRLFGLMFQSRLYLVLTIVSMVGYNLFAAAPAILVKNIVDEVDAGKVPPIGLFGWVALGIILIYLLKGIFFFFQAYLMGLMAEQLVTRLRDRLFAHVQTLSFSFFTRHPAGDLMSRFTSDMVNLQKALRMGIAGPLRDIPQIFIFLTILVYRSWQLALLSAVLIPIALALISKFGQRSNELATDRLSSFGHMNALLMETISGIRVVKAFGMERYEQHRFAKANQELLRKNMRAVSISSASPPVLELIGAVAGAVIVVVGGYLILFNMITGGDFASFLFAFFMLTVPINRLNGFVLVLQEGVAAATRVFDMLDMEPEVMERPGAAELAPIKKSIAIRVNSFRYAPTNSPVLKNIELDVKAGEVVALVGSSGSGKTTLVNLIPRFFDLSDGRIEIDGTDIQRVTLSSLRKQIAIVTQEIFLFNDTFANNIAYGNIDCPMEEIISAATAANAHEFIMAMPGGYDTMIGEGGFALSGGQRQRLSVARALIKNAPILILDEATSALDPESEIEVQQALENLLANRTTIVIAHRLSTIARANQIYVLENGSIVENGRHEELLAAGGQYNKLYEMQFREPGQAPATGQGGTLRRWLGRFGTENPGPVFGGK